MQQPENLDFVTLDVFTQTPFLGNPLAIVQVPKTLTLQQHLKQRIAREFNFSETVFLYEEGDTPERRIEIYTTTEEIPFAGHPTIGTICYICGGDGSAEVPMQSLTLLCKAGPLQVQYDGQNGIAEARIPHNVRIHKTAVPWRSVLQSQPSLLREPEKRSQRALRSPSESSVGVDGGDGACPLVSIVRGMSFILVELPQIEDLLNLKVGSLPIDHGAIKWDDGWSSFTTPYYYAIESQDPVNRTFKLRARMISEVGEDPATGSAACTLGAFLALQIAEGGKTYTFSIDQGVEMGRHSNIGVQVTLEESGRSITDVRLSGSAVLVSKGTLKSR